uniref:Uncharacterized protein n=1 Tax=Solanum tuberosum TaxID=4113 RepID=M1AN48_SOLTU
MNPAHFSCYIRLYTKCIQPNSTSRTPVSIFGPVYRYFFRVYLCIQLYRSCILPSFGFLRPESSISSSLLSAFNLSVSFKSRLTRREGFEPSWLNKKMRGEEIKSVRSRKEFHMQQK